MLPKELRHRVTRVAEGLETERSAWHRNIAARLREVATYEGPDVASVVRRRVSLADYNHLQSTANYLTAVAAGWRASMEPYAAAIANDLDSRLDDVREQQTAIIELIQFGWTAE